MTSYEYADLHQLSTLWFGYATDLRSMSQGRANYSMEFLHYSEVPKSVSEAIMAERGSDK